MQKRAFGELELSVLKIVREQSPVTVHGVLQLLGGDNRYTTVMTVMNRLVKKGELTREKKREAVRVLYRGGETATVVFAARSVKGEGIWRPIARDDQLSA